MRYQANRQVALLDSLTLASVCATDFLCGAAYVSDEEDGWARPQRFGKRQLRALASCLSWHPGKYRQMAHTSAGVCVRFATDASCVALAVTLDEVPPAVRSTLRGMPKEQTGVLSLVVDGERRESIEPVDGIVVALLDAPQGGMPAMASLPGMGQRHEVCLWLPCLRGCAIRELWTDGTYVEVVPERPRMLVLGDGLGQGFFVADPALTWPALLSENLGLELVNQSVGGQVFQPSSILDAQVDDVEQVIVELGANYAWERCDVATVAADVRGFFSEVSRHWPDARVCVVLPDWSNPQDPRRGSCYSQVPELLRRAAAARGLDVVDGAVLVRGGLWDLPSRAQALDERGSEHFATRLALLLAQSHLTSEELRDRALSLLSRADAASGAIVAYEALRRGSVSVVVADEGCVVLRTPKGGAVAYGECASLVATMCGMLDAPPYVNVLGAGIAQLVADVLGMERVESYHVCVYEHSVTRTINPMLAERIRPLDVSFEDAIRAHYTFASRLYDDELAVPLSEGRFFGAFEGDELVGFVGEHPEGSIGMLEVFQGHRRKGWGEALEATKINDHLRRGEVPWTEVYPQNRASLRLQKKLGFTVLPAVCAGFVSGANDRRDKREEDGVTR